MPKCSAIDLAEIRGSSKVSSWIWSIISGLVTVLGRPGRGASHVEKSTSLYWTTKFWRWHKFVHVTLMFLSEWREFPSAPCLQEKKPYTTCDLDLDFYNRLSRYCQWLRYQRDLVACNNCIVSSETQFETWWWPSERAETCSLSNKYYTILLVVFDCTTVYQHII